jgi:hypothetical protein
MHENLLRTRSLARSTALVAALLVAACSAGQSSANHDDSSDNTAAKPAAGANMSSFQKTLAHFRKAAAKRLNQPEGQVEVVPGAENINGYPEFALGPFIAFDATAGRDMVRGLAEPGGKVVIGSKGQIEGLGHLLEAANALDPARTLPALDLAVRIVWLQGAEYFLIATGHDTWKLGPKPPANLAEPTLTRAGDGSAELRFFVNEAGNTGVIIGHEVVIRIAPGYQATMSMKRPAP